MEEVKKLRRRVGYGRKRLSNIEMMERIVRKELEALWKKYSKKGSATMTPEDARKLESLTRSQKNLDERAASLSHVDREVDAALDEMTPEQIREAMKELKSKAQEADPE